MVVGFALRTAPGHLDPHVWTSFIPLQTRMTSAIVPTPQDRHLCVP